MKMWKLCWKKLIPLVVTVAGVVLIDLLSGVALGMAIGIFIILLKSFQNSHFLHKVDEINGLHKMKMVLAEEVTFINKGTILKELNSIPENTHLCLDVRATRYLDYDVMEILDDFAIKIEKEKLRALGERNKWES